MLSEIIQSDNKFKIGSVVYKCRFCGRLFGGEIKSCVCWKDLSKEETTLRQLQLISENNGYFLAGMAIGMGS